MLLTKKNNFLGIKFGNIFTYKTNYNSNKNNNKNNSQNNKNNLNFKALGATALQQKNLPPQCFFCAGAFSILPLAMAVVDDFAQLNQ